MLNTAWIHRIQSINPDKGTSVTFHGYVPSRNLFKLIDSLLSTYTCSDPLTAKVYHEPTGTNFLDCGGTLAKSISVNYLSPTESQPISVLPSGCALAGYWVEPRTLDNETLPG